MNQENIIQPSAISDSTPIVTLTAGQLRSLIREERASLVQKQTQLVYGLQGIADLFGVGIQAALRYKKTFLAPAISQQGSIIICDREKAIELFREHKEGKS